MKTEELINLLEEQKFDAFYLKLTKLNTGLTNVEKQELLVNIIDYHYTNEKALFYKKAFDLIIGGNLNLDFNIDHWAPTFLSLVVLRAPSTDLMAYFIEKGADLNFIGDTLAFEKGKNLEFEKKYLLFNQYQTCLDFAQIKLNDLLTVDYSYEVPKRKVDLDWRELIDENDTINLSKREYLYLHEQAEYLHDLIKTDKLMDYIKLKGGKTFEELPKKTH